MIPAPLKPYTSRERWTALIILLGIPALAFLILTSAQSNWQWWKLWDNRLVILRGLGVTALVSFCSLLLSVILGAILALIQEGTNRPLLWLARGFTELIRGTPLLVQVLIGYYLVGNAFKLDNKFIAGVLILSAFTSAYLGEIFRAGIASVGATQREAARAVGFNAWQTYRYVILPQAVQRVLPALAGQSASLIKDSSLLSVIGLQEIEHETNGVINNSYLGLEAFLPLAVAYLMLTLPLSLWARRLEKKFAYES